MFYSRFSAIWALMALLWTVTKGQQLTCKTWLLGERFNEMYPHHGHIDIIWHTLWRSRAVEAVVPFTDGNITDFDPIFNELIQRNLSNCYDPAFSRAFIGPGQDLLARAQQADNNNDQELASELYGRAAAVFRVGRYPNPVTPTMRQLWEMQKHAYFLGAGYLDPPVESVQIPHTHGTNGDGPTIPAVVRHNTTAGDEPRPVLLLLTGLDEFRTDFNPQTLWATQQGWHTVVVEIPGTGDSPANRSDPAAGNRLWASVLDWMDEQPEFDSDRVVAWGISTGSYYGIQLAHYQADRIRGVAALGPVSHKGFDPEWISRIDYHENPFNTTPSLIYKWGYNSLEEFQERSMQDYSLVLDGTLERNSTQLLLLNGLHDGLFPAEDTLIPLDFGRPKQARVWPGEEHGGGEESFTMAMDFVAGLV